MFAHSRVYRNLLLGQLTSLHKLGLVDALLDHFCQFSEIVVVVDSKEKLGKVWGTLVIVFEV